MSFRVGLAVLLVCVPLVLGDVYLHNPRGSNNRLNEANQNRANNNRIFDSQNNNRGGYNIGDKTNEAADLTDDSTIGRLRYYSGSKLLVEWTNQHGCSNPKMHCNMVLQYMCDQTGFNAFQDVAIEDGQTTNNNNNNRGNHESEAYHTACKTRSRNKGLFVAGENVNNNNGARATRQNPNGNDRGRFECPEERDYYPYWHPTPWRDIANLVDSQERCTEIETLTSENTVARYHCVDSTNSDTALAYNNKDDCDSNGGSWTTGHTWGLSHPDCKINHHTRVNHLGNSVGTLNTPNYEWTLPSTNDACGSSTSCPKCVLRLRYNMTVGDYDPGLINNVDSSFSTSQSTEKTTFFIENDNDKAANNKVLQNVLGNGLQLAFNVEQTGRTFQDRTHSFSIEPAPSGVGSADIININVRGRKGNIVQVYPAVEYDFVPNDVTMAAGNYVHFAWTGSNTSPTGKDRSNVVQIGDSSLSFPTYASYVNMFNTAGSTTVAMMDKYAMGDNACATPAEANTANQINHCQFATQDHGLMQMNTRGTYHYMSTVNNDFTNRGHKGKITVT